MRRYEILARGKLCGYVCSINEALGWLEIHDHATASHVHMSNCQFNGNAI